MNNNYMFLILAFCVVIAFVVIVVLLLNKIKNIKIKYENNLKLVTNTVNSVRYGNLSTRLVLDNDLKYPNLADSINRMVETIQDREQMISEFKKEITGHNVFLETLINSLSEGFLILDDNFNIKKMTQTAELVLGNNALNMNLYEFIDFDNSNSIENTCSIKTFLKNNSAVFVEVTISNLTFQGNSEFKYLVTIKDISKENELSQIKNDFIATLAHDLRVPLIAEANTLNLLKKGNFGSLNPEISNVIEMLLQSNKDTIILTDVLLETYKLEQTQLVLNKQDVSINLLVKEVCDEMFGVLESNNIKISFNLCDDFVANIDIFQFKRVLRNIINNSIDYSSQKSDKIDIYTITSNDGFSIKVRDYGYGINDDEKDKIFQKFYSGAHKFRKVGSGLGLYLANEIVKLHGGVITIQSEPNVQTDFEIYIPFTCKTL